MGLRHVTFDETSLPGLKCDSSSSSGSDFDDSTTCEDGTSDSEFDELVLKSSNHKLRRSTRHRENTDRHIASANAEKQFTGRIINGPTNTSIHRSVKAALEK